MRFVVITGPSGAGKTLALHSFEDAGYFTVENLPPRLVHDLAAFCEPEGRDRVAAVIDARSGPAFAELPSLLDIERRGSKVELLFLDASDDVLVQRYKETRRPHPLITDPTGDEPPEGIADAIDKERGLLEGARGAADRIIDTSSMSAWELRTAIHNYYAPDTRPGLQVTLTSFGFKHGLPIDADLMFDVRFLANPHYVPDLKGLDGRNPRVAAYVHADSRAGALAGHIDTLIQFALPEYEHEGKAYLNIAVGCTGGQHRSVVLVEDLAESLRKRGYAPAIRHRDLVRNQLLAAAEDPTTKSPDRSDK